MQSDPEHVDDYLPSRIFLRMRLTFVIFFSSSCILPLFNSDGGDADSKWQERGIAHNQRYDYMECVFITKKGEAALFILHISNTEATQSALHRQGNALERHS